MSFLSDIPRPIAFTYLLSILYNVTFFMQFVTTPYLIKSLGISDAENGFIQTFFGVFQMVGGPIFGYIIQKWGIRKALTLCYSSTFLSGVLLYSAQDLYTLILSRIPVLFMHGQQGHQTLLSLLTEPGKQRTNAFGRMGLTFGIGFMLTPIFCIVSSKLFHEHAPLIISSILCSLPIIVLQLHIPTSAHEKEEKVVSEEGEKPVMNITNTLRILSKKGVLNVLFKKNAPIVPILLVFAIMQLHMINAFAMEPEMSHLIQLVTGVYIMISNGFGVIWLRKHFEETTLLRIGMMSFSIGYLLFFFFSHLWYIFFILPFVSTGMSLVSTVADSLLTSLVDEKEQGLVLGIATSFNSLVRTAAPAVAGSLLQSNGFSIFPLLGTISTLMGHVALSFMPLDTSLLKKAKTE